PRPGASPGSGTPAVPLCIGPARMGTSKMGESAIVILVADVLCGNREFSGIDFLDKPEIIVAGVPFLASIDSRSDGARPHSISKSRRPSRQRGHRSLRTRRAAGPRAPRRGGEGGYGDLGCAASGLLALSCWGQPVDERAGRLACRAASAL